MSYICFKKGCEIEAQYVRKCLLSEIYCCETHFKAQVNLIDKTLSFESLFAESYQQTKDAIIVFLEKKKAKREKLKKDILVSGDQSLDNLRENIEETLKNLNSDLEEITRWIEMVSQTQKISKKEQDPLLNLLILQPDYALKRLKTMIPPSSEQNNSIRRLYWLNELRAKTSDIWNKFNSCEFEKDFRKTCSLYENQNFSSDLLLNQVYQEYMKAYHQTKSIYHIYKRGDDIKLFIYDTEEKREEVKVLDLKGEICSLTITQLPNGELFFTYQIHSQNEAVIIDRNYGLRFLPSAPSPKLCPIIYYDGFLYCSCLINGSQVLVRLNLDQKHWNCLSFIPSESICNSVIFNGNILIARKSNLLLYSVEINSFSIIPYEYEDNKNMWINTEESNTMKKGGYALAPEMPTRVFLIKVEERLYLIGSFLKYILIYENVGNEYTWIQVAKSICDYFYPIPCLYNKRKIFFDETEHDKFRHYCEFDFDLKAFNENSYYFDYMSLKQVGKKIVAIEWNGQAINFGLDSAYAYISKGKTSKDLGCKLNFIESISKKINNCPHFLSYYNKGEALLDFDMYNEAIECFDEALKIKPCYQDSTLYYKIWCFKGEAYRNLNRNYMAVKCYDEAGHISNTSDLLYKKGCAFLYGLGRSLEAIKCFNEAIKMSPFNSGLYYLYKGNALSYDLGWSKETIKYYYETIKNNPGFDNKNKSKGDMLNTLERNLEAIKCYDKALEFNINKSYPYNNKGVIFNRLGRNNEAIEFHDKAIEFNPNYYWTYCHRAITLNDLECEIDALEDLNTAYNLMQTTVQECYVDASAKAKLYAWKKIFIDDGLIEDYMELFKKVVQLQEFTVEFKNEFQNLINTALDSPVLIKKFETQKKSIKAQNNQFITKFIEFLGFNYYESYEKMRKNLDQLEKEAAKNEKLVIANISNLKSTLMQNSNKY